MLYASVLVYTVGTALMPLLPVSFSLDFSGILTGAEDIVNNLFPLFTPIIGWQFGFGLLLFIMGIVGSVIASLAHSRR
jgi:hypothetical protein